MVFQFKMPQGERMRSRPEQMCLSRSAHPSTDTALNSGPTPHPLLLPTRSYWGEDRERNNATSATEKAPKQLPLSFPGYKQGIQDGDRLYSTKDNGTQKGEAAPTEEDH